MGRHQEFDTDQVLQAAMNLFWCNGYKKTSVRDVVQATGVAESSLYNAFGGKRRLFEASLDRYRFGVRQLRRRMEDFDSPGEGIRWYINTIVKILSGQEDHRGCMVTNTTIELAPHDAQIQSELRVGYAESEDAFCRAITKAQAAGEIDTKFPPRTLARFLIQSLEGLRVLAKSNPGAEILREMGTTTLDMLFPDDAPRATTDAKRSSSKKRKPKK